MISTRRFLGPLLGITAVIALLVLTRGGIGLPVGDDAHAPATAATVDQMVGTAALVVARLGAIWLALTTLLSLAGALPGVAGRACAALSARITPRVVRRALATATGMSLAVGPGFQALAAPDPHASAAAPRLDRVPTVAPPPRQQPPGARARAHPAGSPSPTASHAASVVVAPGDSLWRLAERSLGASATPRRVSREWPRWYAVNRAIIGTDPDVLRPGQRLEQPR